MNIEEIKHNFATNVIRLRKSRNLSQIEFGEEIHYSSKAISKWENEETLPGIDVISNVASYFDLTIDEIISNKDVVYKSYKKRNRFYITLSSGLLSYLVALLIFFALNMANIEKAYLSFICGAIASSIVFIVFTKLFYSKKALYLSILYCIFSCALLVMFLLNFELWWLVLVIAFVLALLFFVFFMIKFPTHKNKNKK